MNLFAHLVGALVPDTAPEARPLDRRLDEAVLDVAQLLQSSATAARRLQDELQVLHKLTADYEQLVARRSARITSRG